MKVDLHIGHTKTGTSVFQHLMAGSKSSLHKQNILYPKSGLKFNAHHGLVNVLINQRVRSAGEPTTSIKEILAELRRAEKKGYERAIISSEGFMVIRDAAEGIDQILTSYDVRVYAFLRPPVSWVNSMLNQTYKNVLYKRAYVDNCLTQFERAKRFIQVGMKYHERLSVWQDIVGKDNLSVTCMEKGADYLTEMLRVMNIELKLPKSVDSASTNISLCGESLQFLAWLADREEGYSHSEVVRFMKILNDYSRNNGKSRPKNYIPRELAGLAVENADKTRAEISRLFFDGKPVLEEDPDFIEYFDFQRFDPNTVLAVNRYVLSRLDARIQEIKKY